jgi:hypothetical protein
MSTYAQAKSLLDDLKTAQGSVSWQVGKIGNALLDQAKREKPDNAVLAVIDPFKPDQGDMNIADMEASDVRAVLGQIVAAIKPSLSIG